MFGPKFKDSQIHALAKCISDFDKYGDEAITRFSDDCSTENIPLTSEFTPISISSSLFDREKKKKSVIRNNFNLGVIRGFAWQMSDHENDNVDEKYISKLIKEALKKSELPWHESSMIYKLYVNADRDDNWGKGVFFASIFLVEYQGVAKESLY